MLFPALLTIVSSLVGSEAWAGGLEAKSSREPLPARQVERPIVLPKGWLDVAVSTERELAGVPGEWSEAVTLRRGIFPRHELSVTLGEAGSGLGWRGSLLRREPPTTGLALEAFWWAPAEFRAGLAARRQWGGLRVTGRFGGIYRYETLAEPLGIASLEALLQAGPLAFVGEPMAEVSGSRGLTSELRLRGTVQWTRGFDTGVTAAIPVARSRSRRVGLAAAGRF